MPLPVKKKYGFSFLVQPPLTQQLGIFSQKNIEESIIDCFIQNIPYKSYHLNLNEQNHYSKGIKQPNYILNLSKDYDAIFSEYSKNTKRNVKKSYLFNPYVKTDLSVNDFLKFYHAVEKNYHALPKKKVDLLVEKVLKNKKGTIFGAFNANNELMSALFLLHSPQRLIYLLPVSNNEGKETLAMFRIVDEIIRNYSNQNCSLDFAGSCVKSVSQFYQGFGATEKSYFMTKYRSVNSLIESLFFWK